MSLAPLWPKRCQRRTVLSLGLPSGVPSQPSMGLTAMRLPIFTSPRWMGSRRDEFALSTLESQGRLRFSVRRYSWNADTSLIEARRRIVGALIQLGLLGLFALRALRFAHAIAWR